MPTSYTVNNLTVYVVDDTVHADDGKGEGVPILAIAVSSTMSAVVIFVGMALFTW
jgi:hypothetical protein